jgi:hypothetical protein
MSPKFLLGALTGARTLEEERRLDPVPRANPYWAEHGLRFADPEGFLVVPVPERWER